MAWTPFSAFVSYPTHTLRADTVLQRTDVSEEVALMRLRDHQQLLMVSYAKTILASDAEVQHIVSAAQHSQSAAFFSEQRRSIAFRSLLWLIKLRLLRAV